MKLPCILLFALLILPVALQAQDKYILSGHVTGEKNDTLAAGSVYLLAGKDSSIVKYALLTDGKFTFDPVSSGEYIIRISSLGYHDELKQVVLQRNTSLQISLKAGSTALNTITVAAKRRDFTFKNGDVKVTIAGSVFAAIPSAVDMLSKLPMIQVSPNGETVSIVGKGNALIYIDRQKASINDLATLSANDIQDVQILRNPPAKYEAEGRAVIVITRRKDKKDGFQAELQETASIKRRYNNYTGLNLNFKRKKWEVISSLKYNNRRIWESNSYSFHIQDRGIESAYSLISIITKSEYIANTGVHYQINTDDHLSMNINTRLQEVSFPIYTNSTFSTPSEKTSVYTLNQSTYPKQNYTASLNYEKNLKKINADLFVGSQYAAYSESFLTDIFNNYNNTQPAYTEHRDQQYDVHVLGTRADLTKSFKNGISMETGVNVSTAGANAILNIYNISLPAHSFSDYLYTETNTAAYIQFSGKLQQLSYSLGARAEYTHANGGYKEDATPVVKKQYGNIFPKASLNIPLKEGINISLNYAKSITRPNYMSLSQVANYINPYFVWASNININPTISDDISAGFQWKGKSANVTCYRRSAPIYASFVYDPSKTLLTRTDINYNAEKGCMVDITVPFQYGIWTSTNYASVILNSITDAAAVMGKTSPYLYCYSNNQFKLPGNFTCALSGWALTKRYEGVYERNALMQVDTSLTKTFPAARINCTIAFNDIFRTLNAKENFTLNNINSRGFYYEDVRELSIAVRYAFGTTRESKYKNKNVDGNINRL